MREFAFNDACGEGAFSSRVNACDALSNISIGMASLVDAGLTHSAIRLSKPVSDIIIGSDLSLFDAMLEVTNNAETKDQGVFLMHLSQKVPLEQDLDDESFERLAGWALKDHPDCYGLLLCASSDRIAVSAAEDSSWHNNFVEVSVVKPDPIHGHIEEHCQVGNVYSDKVEALKKAIIEEGIGDKSAADIWDERAALFPHLIFAPSVANNLKALGDIQFSQAVKKLQQLNTSASKWEGRPCYVLDVRGETESTMNKYGKLRKFLGEDGASHIYELHANVTDGFRVHVRELPDTQKIEVGYIGPHLKVSKRN
ncbi:hypothetical protein [Celeribacter halophilus]|uniref:hypothetical protein n=1 Tax=Celeribacter halophilus TaxID=576117 RepID=UPI001C098B7B|nr:hypothetical protein [Celeribacter halophilus]MBU2889920.1 hypothetical protein [Celeribacter halophilus]MDO6509258.1 hypothetical protein [Celeribacter halophilus]